MTGEWEEKKTEGAGSPKSGIGKLFFIIATVFFKIFFGVVFRFPLLAFIKIEGQRHVPREGGLIVIANHLSIVDPPILWYAMPRHLCFMGREDILRMPVLGGLARLARMIPVKQRTADRTALKQAIEAVKAGEAVSIFPEGEVSPTGELLDFLPGVMLILRQTHAPVLPVAILNTHKIVPHGALIPRPAFSKITVRFGEVMHFEELLDDKANDQLVLERMQEAVKQILM